MSRTEMDKIKILVVEDDKVNQLVAKSLLIQWGMEVTTADNGEQAIEKIRNKEYRLVLMDIQMPVLDGFEATRQIRAMDDPYFKTIPILAFTASGMIEVNELAYQHGMTDFVAKPFIPEELKSRINKYLQVPARPLFIDFNLYADDLDFKMEFISLLIENIKELQQSVSQNVSKIFQAVLHKVTSTVVMLGDQEFADALDEVKLIVAEGGAGVDSRKKLSRFHELCNQVIDSLRAAGEKTREHNSNSFGNYRAA